MKENNIVFVKIGVQRRGGEVEFKVSDDSEEFGEELLETYEEALDIANERKDYFIENGRLVKIKDLAESWQEKY